MLLVVTETYEELTIRSPSPALRRMVEASGYDGYVEVEIFSQRNWWQRDPDEVIGVIKDRVQTAV